MPRYNLAVPPSSKVEGKAILVGLLCTLPTSGVIQSDISESFAAVCDQKNDAQKLKGRRPYITNLEMLDEIMDKHGGELYVYKRADKQVAHKLRKLAMQSDPVLAEEIKMLESEGVPYVIEVRPRTDLVDGAGDGAIDVWDTEGLVMGSALYKQALENLTRLKGIETVDMDQAVAIKTILTIVGNLARTSPDTPAKNRALRFQYFLSDVSEVLSSLKSTNAPKALLPCAVTAVFAEYKKKYWDDGVVKMAGKEAAEELEASAAALLDERYVDEYLKFTESAELTPPGPSCEAFDVAFGALSVVDPDLTSAFRHLIVGLHDTVMPQIESLLNKISSTMVEGSEASNGQDTGNGVGSRKVQIHQVKVCIRNYMQCLYNIAQDFVPIHRKSVPDEKAELLAVMHNRISDVNQKFWPILANCLAQLCDSSVVEDIRSKYHVLTEQLSGKSQRMMQATGDDQLASVEESSSEGFWSRMISCAKNLVTTRDDMGGVEENATRAANEELSPMFSNLLKVVEDLGFYKQIASSSPEETPTVPESIPLGDRVSLCAALGFVNKPKAAALFTFLNRLQEYLDHADYKGIAKEAELPSIEKFRHVDWHIWDALKGKEEFSFVHDKMDTEVCDKIMTSSFKKYFDECWPHVAAVLEGGGQEDVIETFKTMASDIIEWKPSADLDQEQSQIIKNLKKVFGTNASWFLAGMAHFVQGASFSEKWSLTPLTQEMWTHGLCPGFKIGDNTIYRYKADEVKVCLPSSNITSPFRLLDLAEEGSITSYEAFRSNLRRCYEPSGWEQFWGLFYVTNAVKYSSNGEMRSLGGKGTDIVQKAAEMKINTTCNALEAFWYDISDTILHMLCSDALGDTIDFGRSPCARNDTARNDAASDDKLNVLVQEYKFNVVTGVPGNRYNGNLAKNVFKSNFQGFVMCHSGVSTKGAFAKKFIDAPEKHYLNLAMDQRRCRHKKYKGSNRDYRIFYSTATIDRQGKIFIEKWNHRGLIGSCWPSLFSEYKKLYLEGYRDSVADKRARQTRDVSNQTGPMTKEEIYEAFLKAKREGLIEPDELLGNYTDNWNDPSSFNITAQEEAFAQALLGPPDEGCSGPSCDTMEFLSPYWPIVWSALGAATVCTAAKMAWNRFRPRTDGGYKAVTTADTAVTSV
eukprot:Blabericola_migrator_1__2979@NODE_1860_length_3646_cov_31_803576_g1022_i3_p1_GENE_NODE_1860_length_3646_cov_31_803576_g1022_i3NODE_1860_length_3646_cov_31_803576_g1022_i3_p1_ORF_typecomplete_len1147_score235_72_NODE_1860_length_3646_cov_31_803576_g1022_i31313571